MSPRSDLPLTGFEVVHESLVGPVRPEADTVEPGLCRTTGFAPALPPLPEPLPDGPLAFSEEYGLTQGLYIATIPVGDPSPAGTFDGIHIRSAAVTDRESLVVIDLRGAKITEHQAAELKRREFKPVPDLAG